MININLFYNDEMDVTIHHDGIVLKEYDETRDGYNFKIIGNVAVVDDYEVLHVYGAANEDVTYLRCNENQLVGFTDKPIDIHIISKDVTTYRLPEGETVISPYITEDGDFTNWALVLYEQSPVVYVRYDDFDESSYKELTSILSKLYFL